MTHSAVRLKVNSVVGTGDPFDQIMLIPLIADWRVPRPCVFCAVEGKSEQDAGAITRLLVLREPFDSHKVVGCCEAHWESKCAAKHAEEVDRGDVE